MIFDTNDLFKDRDSVLNDMYCAREEIFELDKLISIETDINELQLLQDIRTSQIFEYELNSKLYNLNYREYDLRKSLNTFKRLKLEKDNTPLLICQFASYLYEDNIKAIEVVPSSFLVIDFDNINTVARSRKADNINSLNCIDIRFNNLTNEDMNKRGVDAIVYLNDNSIALIDLKCIKNEKQSLNKKAFGSKINYYITLELEKIENNKYVDSYITDPLLLSEKIFYYVVEKGVYVLDRLKLKDYICSKKRIDIDLSDTQNKREDFVNSIDKDVLNVYQRERNSHSQIDINVQILIEKEIAKFYSYSDFKNIEYSHSVIEK